MHTYKDWLPQVQSAVLEIKDFYDRCNQNTDTRLRLNVSMLSYALGLDQISDVYSVLGSLDKQGYLLDADGEFVTFSGQLIRPVARS
jgi:hypothetical protein